MLHRLPGAGFAAVLLLGFASSAAGAGGTPPPADRGPVARATAVSDEMRAEEDRSLSDDAPDLIPVVARRDPFRVLVGEVPDVEPPPTTSCEFGWREATLGGIGNFAGKRIAIFHGPEARTCFLREGQLLGDAAIRRIDREHREVVLRVPVQDPRSLTSWRDFTVRLYPVEEAGKNGR